MTRKLPAKLDNKFAAFPNPQAAVNVLRGRLRDEQLLAAEKRRTRAETIVALTWVAAMVVFIIWRLL